MEKTEKFNIARAPFENERKRKIQRVQSSLNDFLSWNDFIPSFLFRLFHFSIIFFSPS